MAVFGGVLANFLLVITLIQIQGRTINEENNRLPRALLENTDELDKGSWLEKAQNVLKKQLAKKPNEKQAKNVILFLGDGMSVATVSAARILQGQKAGHTGEENSLSFEEFPFTGFSKTYCVDKQVADSACSATAYLGGVKNNLGTIGVSAAVKRNDCKGSANPANHVDSISSWAQAAGKLTGIVTTTRVTHASPSGTYGHTSERDWESDHDILMDDADPKICPDLAHQLVNNEPGKNHRVILGGGRRKFLPKGVLDEDNKPGEREDGINLINVWKEDKDKRKVKGVYVTNRDSLLAVPKEVDYLFGLFNNDHMDYHLDSDLSKSPTLAEMTAKAIEQLSQAKDGYFLFVEGGRIDQAHHATLTHKALDETIEFSEAIKTAQDLVSDDTLIVVTADHAHTMSFAGYPVRGQDILGFGGNATDGLPYSTLVYANGPSYRPENNGRYNMIGDDRHAPNYTFPSFAPLKEETHGGDDVQVFATGPWSHLFVGAYEQNAIPHIMAFASCIGHGLTMCNS